MNVFNLKAVIGLDTSDYEAELKKSHGLAESFGSKLGGVFSSLASTAGNMLSSAGTKLTGFMADAVEVGKSFDSAMSQVAATMRTTMNSDEMQMLRDFAMEMGEKTAEALNYMALAGYNAETSMEMLPKVLDLAAAGGIGLAEASNMLTTSLNAFGFDVRTEAGLERASKLIDEMAVTAGTTSTDIAQLGAALQTMGAYAGELNGGFIKMSDGSRAAVDGVTELETALGLMANAGITASEAGTHMRNMMAKMTADSDKIKEALGVDVFDEASGQMRSLKDIFSDLQKAMFGSGVGQDQRLKWISELFNTRDTASLEAVLKSVATDWDRIGEGLVNSAGAAEAMKEAQLDNLAGDMQLLNSAMESFKIKLSDQLSPVLRRGVELATDFISSFDFSGIAEGLSTFTDPLMDYLEIFEANGPLQAIKAIGWDLEDALKKFGNLSDLDFSGFGESLGGIAEVGRQVAESLGSAIANSASAIGSGVMPLLSELGTALTNPESFKKTCEMAGKVVSNFADGLLSKESLDIFFSTDKGIPKVLANIATNLGTGISAIITAAGDIIGKIIGYMADPQNYDTIKSGAIKILLSLRDALKKVIESLDVTFNNVMKALATALGEQFDGTEAGFEIAEKLAHGIWENFKRNALWLPTAIGEWLAGEGEESVPEHASSSHSSQANGPSSRSASSRSTSSGNTTADYYQHLGESAASSASTGNTTADYYMNLGARGHALGGIVTRPTYALIGEQGAEAVMPLEHNTGWIRQLAQELGGGQTVIQFGDIYVNGDADAGQQVAEQIDRALRELQIRQARGIGGTAWKQ